jgi:hypothetical protein
MLAAETGVLGPQGVELTLQAGVAINQRGEASVHDELRC